MSKLPQAPLVEVVFELKWDINTQDKMEKFRFLPGDLATELKQIFPWRESLVPVEIPLEIMVHKPVFRHRVAAGGYPLFQVGPGIVSLNFSNDVYFWEVFEQKASVVIEKLFSCYQFTDDDVLTPALTYIDFFGLDFNSRSAFEYINENFSFRFIQLFDSQITHPSEINLGFSWRERDNNISGMIHSGFNAEGQSGIIMQTKCSAVSLKAGKRQLIEWLNQAHNRLSSLFKGIIQEHFYESFK